MCSRSMIGGAVPVYRGLSTGHMRKSRYAIKELRQMVTLPEFGSSSMSCHLLVALTGFRIRWLVDTLT